MFITKLKKQAAKYDKNFGPGAMVFRYGFSAELDSILPGTLLLDSTPLDLSELTRIEAEVAQANLPL
jgi:hypothetical protein